ncbi:septum formation family protein [Georgenia sp. SYP-B2076]|uniref:septum formation family protein n=1 Tax=Georgenia sp. SYP-B2076 TaxID=2495881 RepID=UPI000F8CC02F|nr:septum formation family protein [Georgenia sp. SYP-B2076]
MTTPWGAPQGGPLGGSGAVAPARNLYGQSFGTGQPHNSPPPSRPTTGAGRPLGLLAILVALPLGPLGVVLGGISYTQARRGNGPRAPGVAAMILGALMTLGVALWVLTSLATALTTIDAAPGPGGPGPVPIGAMEVGDCALDLDPGVPTVELVDCGERHQAEAFADVDLGRGAYPGPDAVVSRAESRCLDAADAAIPADADTSDIRVAVITPDQRAWDQGLTAARCVILDAGGRGLTGSLADGTLQTH